MKVSILDWSGHHAKMDDLLNLCVKRLVEEIMAEQHVPVTFVNKACKADILIVGGGTLLFSGDKGFYRTIEAFNGPYFFLGTGYRGDELEKNSPFVPRMNRILEKSIGVGLRGPVSYREIERLGTDMDRVEIVGDVAFQFEPGTLNHPKSNFEVGISVRYMGRSGEPQYTSNQQVYEIMREIAGFLHLVHPDGHFYLFDTCWNIHDSDRKGLKRIKKMCNLKKEQVTWVTQKDLDEFCSMIGQMDFIVSQRLHPNILSWLQDIPCIVLDYKNNKALDFMKTLDLERYCMKTNEFTLEHYKLLYHRLVDERGSLIEKSKTRKTHYRAVQKDFAARMIASALRGINN